MGQGPLRLLNRRASGTSVIRAHLSTPEGSVNRFAFLLFALALPGCIDEAGVDAIFCDPDEPCWEERGLDGAGGEACPVGPLGYNPTRTDAEPVVEPPASNAIAVSVDAFDKATTCNEVVIGLFVTASCAMPKKLSLFAFDSAANVPTSTPDNATTITVSVVPDMLSPGATDGVQEVHIPWPTTHIAGRHPVLGIGAASASCLAEFSTECDSARAIGLGQSWSEVPGTSYYLGFSDCH